MIQAHSPLFEPVLWEGAGFKILDELALPDDMRYISISELAQAVDAVRAMKTRAFGQVLTFLYSGALVARCYKGKNLQRLRDQLTEMTQQFCQARPTFDFKGLGSQLLGWVSEAPPEAELGNWIERRAREMAARIIRVREARARRAAAALPDPARILTHCNVSGELVAIAQQCRAMGKEVSVVATETRPYLQGTRLTAWELSRAGVQVTAIPDCAVAQVIAAGEVNAVVVGSDRCARNGDIINKVGTYPLALVADRFGVPFYALVQEPGNLAHGIDLEIEERPAAELLSFGGRSVLRRDSDAVTGRYPAFDITPSRLISFFIGFDDQFTPDTFRQKYGSGVAGVKRRPQSACRYLLIFGVPERSYYSKLRRLFEASGASSVLVPEMRPSLSGAQIVVPELRNHELPATMISDNMMGALFAAGEIERLQLCCDQISKQCAKTMCGGLLAALLANAHGVPVEAVRAERGRFATLDRDVSTFLGQRLLPSGVSVRHLQIETVPSNLIEASSGAEF